jgi:putative copper export protein/methionine-rich copper-binding protein CopC
VRQLLLIAAVCSAVFAARPSTALAHDGLVRSVPAKDAHLSAAPRSLRLTFTNAPQLRFARIQLFAPNESGVALGALRVDSVRTVVADIAGPLAGGVYTVAWQIMGADGHPVRGRFTFIIAPGATGLGVSHAAHTGDTTPSAPPAPTAHHDPATMPSGPGFDAESPAYVAIRWATFTALLALLGVLAFRFVVLPLVGKRAPLDRVAALTQLALPRAAWLGVVAAAVLVAFAMTRLLAQSYALHGVADALTPSLVWGMLANTTWGLAWLVHVAAAGVAFFAFVRARQGSKVGWKIATLASVGIVLTLSLSGHAVSVERWAPIAVAADGLHILGAGGWLGSLLTVLVVGMPSAMALPASERGPAVADIVNAFSPTALGFAGLAALTGVFAAWLHLGSIPALWTSTYGRTLLLKLGVLSVVALTGAYNWRRVRPTLDDVRGAARLRKSAATEILVGVVVIAITAVLVATPPPQPPDAMAVTH